MVSALHLGLKGDRCRGDVSATTLVLEGNNIMNVPARAICKLTTDTCSSGTVGGIFGTGNEPRSGPLVIRVSSFCVLGRITEGVPSITCGLTRGF